MKPVFTIQTLLDGLPSPNAQAVPTGCHYCNPEIRENGLCDPCWDLIQARLDKLRAHPQIVAIHERLTTLTVAEMRRLSDAHWANFRIHRQTQTRLHHRVGKAYGGDWRDLATIGEEVWRTAEQVRGDDFNLSGVSGAAQDAVYAALAGDLLTPDERRLFTAPWDDVTKATART